jgi:hypothetical protein
MPPKISKDTVRSNDLSKATRELRDKEERYIKEKQMLTFKMTSLQEKTLRETLERRKKEITDLKEKLGEIRIALADKDVCRAEDKTKKINKEYNQTLKKMESQGIKAQEQQTDLESLRASLMKTVLDVNRDLKKRT